MSDTPTPAPSKLDPTSITAAIYDKSDKALEKRVRVAFETLQKELSSIGPLGAVDLGFYVRRDVDRAKLSMSDLYGFNGDSAIEKLKSSIIIGFRESERKKAVNAFVAKVEAFEDQVQELHNMVEDVRHEANNR